MLELIDISHHQGAVDFDAVAADGISGVIVKATEGRDYTDPRWGENWAALAETGLVAGAYHFARPNTDGGGAEDGEAEALHFCRTVLARCPGESFIAALDFEKSGTDPDHSAQMNIDFIAAFERVVVSELGRSPWIYTGKPVWSERVAWTSSFVHLPLWQADYTSAPADMPWPQRTLWQYTGSGSVAGISGNVDRNTFDGTIEDLRALAEPVIYAPASVSGGIMIPLDLAAIPSSDYDPAVALVQGCLLAHGYGPDGLVGSSGRPDGKAGAKTEDALSAFREASGRGAGTEVSGQVWWDLVSLPR